MHFILNKQIFIFQQGKFFSYEACATPPRNLCRNGSPLAPGQNLGDGDHIGGQRPIPGSGNRPGGLGAILGVRTAGEAGEGSADAAKDVDA